MAEKVKKLGLERDYKKYLYFLDGEGCVCRKLKTEPSDVSEVIDSGVKREEGYLYFIDKDGDVARSLRIPRGPNKKKRYLAATAGL